MVNFTLYMDTLKLGNLHIFITHALPSYQFGPSVSHGDEAGVTLKAVYSLVYSTFFLYCISNTDIASGILADRNL